MLMRCCPRRRKKVKWSFVDLSQDTVVREIVTRLKAVEKWGAVRVEGTWGSFAPLLAAHISKELGRPILYIRPHIDDADKVADDLNTFGAEDVEAFAAWEGEEDLADATDETRLRDSESSLVSRRSSLVIQRPSHESQVTSHG